MYTRCPKCSTVFRVTDRHLAIANGKVRCGQCQHVFNAMQHAIDDPQQASTVAAPTNTTSQATTSVKPASRVTPVTETQVPGNLTEPEKEVETPQTVSQTIDIPEAKPAPEPEPAPEEVTFIQQESQDRTTEAESSTLNTAFDADATMIADLSLLDNKDINEIDLDAPAEINQDKLLDDDDEDLFDDSVDDFLDNNMDLDSAIEELTAANKQATDQPIAAPKEQTILAREESNTENIFSTDAYDATSASSVADIFNEMEGQLSLNIDVTEPEEKNNSEDEFDFLDLGDEFATEKTPATEHEEKSIEEQFLDEFDASEEATDENKIDPDELFDEIDLSDLEDDEVTPAIHGEESSLENNDEISAPEEHDVPFQLRNDLERLQAPSRRKWHPLLSLFSIVLLLCLTFAQLAYFRSYEVVKMIPASRPWLEDFCSKVHCVYSGPRDIKQIKLLSRDVRQHPKEKHALLITATMINQASFAQPYPDIHIRLSDISGNVVAERTFNAKTYMGKLSNPFLLMKSKTPVHLNFEVVDPGKDAVNFEFTFQ